MLNKTAESVDYERLETKVNNPFWSIVIMSAIAPINNKSLLDKIKYLILAQASANRLIHKNNISPLHDVRSSMPVLGPTANRDFKLYCHT